MKVFGKKANSVNDLLDKYVAEMRTCISASQDFFDKYLGGALGDDLKELERAVRHSESRCDDIRVEIQALLTTGTFMPDFRSDIFNVIDTLDRVPNKIEDIVVFITIARVSLPEKYQAIFKEMIDVTEECVINLAEAVELILKDLSKATEKAEIVGNDESRVDKLEHTFYDMVFTDDSLDTGQKLLLKRFGEGISSISDRAEDAADRIDLIALKRKA